MENDTCENIHYAKMNAVNTSSMLLKFDQFDRFVADVIKLLMLGK